MNEMFDQIEITQHPCLISLFSVLEFSAAPISIKYSAAASHLHPFAVNLVKN